ncbi:MAG TPA: MTH938/NDUFAF3 family protein [Anaerolineae bacterium]|nr:MTH938/NDUFAF3 family protein [Anaerolineae bacterium]
MATPQITDYGFGRIKVDGESYGKDVIITPDAVLARWWRIEGHSLAMVDLAVAIQARPEVLVIGQGMFGQMAVPEETQASLQASGIELIAQKTNAACETYNRLREKRRVVAALHLTC